MFGATTIVKNSDKEKYVYSCYGMVFDGKVEWSFDKDYARNVRTFGVDNSSLCDADNLKNNLLVLGEGNTFGINKILVFILVKQTQSKVLLDFTL